MERVELHCHSKYSKMDGIAYPYDIVKFAEDNGMSAVAITDHGSIKAFPELEWATSGVDCDVKPIFGIEAYVVNDYEQVVYNYKGQDFGTVVVVDVETTGLSTNDDSIIEIGAIKLENGSVVDSFSTFVNPQRKLSEFIVGLTGITDEMVATAPLIAEAVKLFIEFAGDSVLVAHNANFDIGFIKKAAKDNDIVFEPSYIDTVMLSKYVYPDAKRRALPKLCEEIGIEVEKSHRAVDDAITCSKLYKKMIEGLDRDGIDISVVDNYLNISHFRKGPTFHSTVLIKDQKGKKILYNLISLAEQYNDSKDIFSLKSLVNNREHLLIGSGCECGLLFRAVLDGKADDVIEEIAKKYDFIEVQPHTNNKYLLTSDRYPEITSEQDLINLNLKLIAVGEKLGIPVVATGDVHYINADDLISRNVLKSYLGFAEDDDTDLHFRTTKEMLDAFAYLGKEKAEEIVITNSNKIADMCQEFNLLPVGKKYPKIENQAALLREICVTRAEELFGNPIPANIMERLERELDSVHNSEMEFSFIYLYDLLGELQVEPYEINTRGCAGNLLISYLLGITDFCPTEYNLSPMFVFGAKNDKEPDIDVNFSEKKQKEALKEYAGENVSAKLRAGTDACVSEEGAIYAIKEYESLKGVSLDETTKEKVIKDLSDVYREKSVHPGGIVIIPKEEDLYDFSPLDLREDGTATTYFNYYRLDDCLFKQDLLHYVGLDMLEKLENETGYFLCDLTYDEPEIMRLFTIDDETEELCADLPEYRYIGSRKILKQAKPKNFNELIKVIALSHGTDVWTDNAEKLLSEDKAALSDIIATRDDIFDYLIEHGIAEADAFTITEQIRKGVWARGRAKRHAEYMDMMREAGVPEWYIESCNKICYLFPRAHAISYARVNWRLAWYKVNYPKTYEMVASQYL